MKFFFKISNKTYEDMIKLNIISNLWGMENENKLIVRFVTSFETEISEIDELIKRIKSFCSKN